MNVQPDLDFIKYLKTVTSVPPALWFVRFPQTKILFHARK